MRFGSKGLLCGHMGMNPKHSGGADRITTGAARNFGALFGRQNQARHTAAFAARRAAGAA